jgi:hypothetical protein
VSDEQREPVKVNEMLGKQAAIGPFPANQIIPFGVIILGSFLIVEGVFDKGLFEVFITSIWGIVSWWLLTGQDPDEYLNLYRKHKYRNWLSGGAVYISPLLPRKERQKIKQRARG